MAVNVSNGLGGLLNLGKGGGFQAQLMRGGLGSIIVKAGQAVLAFVLSVVLARILGPDGYGVYAFALAVIMTVAIPSQVGLPQLVVRETAKAHSAEDWPLLSGLWYWSTRAALGFSVGMVLIGLAVLWLLDDRIDEVRVATLGVGLMLIPLVALGNLRGAALRGLRRVVIGQLPEQILRPGLLLATLIVATALVPAHVFTPPQVMVLYALVSAIAFVVGAWLLWCFSPAEIRSVRKRVDALNWRRAALPLALITGIQLINKQADIIMLGLFGSDSDVGVYKVVSQAALLIAFGLQAINQVVMPHFARLYDSGQYERLQRLVTQSARAILCLAIPPAIVFAIFGKTFLTLLFGPAYGDGHAALAILALGQLASAALGSVGSLLNMTGHERDTMRGVVVAALANIILNLLLIPPYGIEGAAVATCVTFMIWNLILYWAVRKRIGIDTTALGRRRAGG